MKATNFAKIFVLILSLYSNLAMEFDVLEKFAEDVFDDFSCLNVQIHDTYDEQRTDVIKRLSRNFSIFLTDDYRGLENCGLLFMSKDTEILQRLENITFEIPIRILYVGEDCENVLTLHEFKPHILQDMDVLLVEAKEKPKIYRKTRHEVNISSVNADFEGPFFHPVVFYSFKRFFVPRWYDYEKRIVKVSTIHNPVFVSLNGNKMTDGVETRIFREILKKLNLTPVITVPTDGLWGVSYENGTVYGGISKAVYIKAADIGFGSLWIEYLKYRYISMSRYWDMICLKFLIAKPKVMPANWDNICEPFPPNIWILVMAAVLVTSAVTSTIRLTHEYLFMPERRRDAKIISQMVTIIGILVNAKSSIRYNQDTANRHLLVWWSMFAMLITTLYSSSLVSHLSYPNFQPMIDTIRGLVEAGYYWGTSYNEPPKGYMFNEQNPWHREFAARYKLENDTTDRINRLQVGNYSILVKCIGDYHFMDVLRVPSHVLHELRTMRTCLNYFMLGFGYRKGLPYAKTADKVIASLVEGGITKYWLNRLFEREYLHTTFSKVYEYKTPPEDIELEPLGLSNLKGAFAFLFFGSAFSVFIFSVELLRGRRTKKKKN